MDNNDKWYAPFVGNSRDSNKTGKGDKSKHNHRRREQRNSEHKQENDKDTSHKTKQRPARKTADRAILRNNGTVTSVRHMFEAAALDDAAQDVLDNFDDIVQDVFPATREQRRNTRYAIRDLSHSLTDERGERRRGYMNDAATLSPYTRYFTWWILVRLTRLFATIGEQLSLHDGDLCMDCGSGPLTVPIALYLACPALRNVRLTWVCTDLSQSALSLGEALFRHIAEILTGKDSSMDDVDGTEGEREMLWQVTTVRSRVGEAVHIGGEITSGKAALVTCANVLNEIQDSEHLTADEVAARYGTTLARYTAAAGTLLVVEPGVPPMAHVLSLIREQLLAGGWHVASPCPHEAACPMNGEGAHTGGKAKWCNFAFGTEDAPERLREVSADSGLTKRRAVISYLLLHKGDAMATGADTSSEGQGILHLRIASDPIYLPGYRTGYYACSLMGLALVIDVSGRRYVSGDDISVHLTTERDALDKDAKTGAVMLYI